MPTANRDVTRPSAKRHVNRPSAKRHVNKPSARRHVNKPSAKRQAITALAGGVGASKLLLGLHDVIDPRDLTVIVNTGDDIVLHGLKISPDLDIMTYTLAGVVDEAKGWGFRGETFHAFERLVAFGR